MFFGYLREKRLIRTPKFFGMNSLGNVGFTVAELIIIVAVVALISTLTFQSFRNLYFKEVLDKEALSIVSILKEARSLTLSSKGATQYGVHFEPDEIVLFTGALFSPSNLTNRVFPLSSQVTLSSVVLTGGGSEIIFDRLTGTTAQYGTTTVSSVNDPLKEKNIVIFQSGLSEIR